MLQIRFTFITQVASEMSVHPRARMSEAEVLLTAIVAMLYFQGVIERARVFWQEYGYIPHVLSKSRLNRRLHNSHLWLDIFADLLAETWILSLPAGDAMEFALDTFPALACDTIRISRCHLFQGEHYRGYMASKRRCCYGLKLHFLVDRYGYIVDFFFTPARMADVAMHPSFDWERLPEKSTTYADRAYNHHPFEDFLQTTKRTFLPMRKKNSKRSLPPWMRFLQRKTCKIIETTGSRLINLWPRHLRAVTPTGFLLKTSFFVLALSLFDLAQALV